MKKLKRVYDAARALNDHTLDDAARYVGKSASMINQVLAGQVTSKPTVDAIVDYCYKAGLKHSIKKIGFEPETNIQKASV